MASEIIIQAPMIDGLLRSQHSAFIMDYENHEYRISKGRYDFIVRNYPISTSLSGDEGGTYKVAQQNGDGIVNILRGFI